ncbi:hypothetical protein EJ04DRAFT_413168, partial [Polyplosphaeria fusca]
LAKTLPPRLLRFFAKFPPSPLLQKPPVPRSRIPTAEAELPTTTTTITTPPDPNAPALGSWSTDPPLDSEPSAEDQEPPYHNPFLPKKNHATGRWYGPRFGLRQQADLVKLASKHGVLELLPYTTKHPAEKERRRVERGLRVKGTGEGQKVKGKLWERTLKGRLEMRRKAMVQMPGMVQEWKQKGHGRGWRKWPKG